MSSSFDFGEEDEGGRLWFRVQGFRVLGFKVYGLGFGVSGRTMVQGFAGLGRLRD